jgi:sulfoxide reductase heme-binding subunit YedZ
VSGGGALWFLSRGSGVVLLVLTTVVVVLGVLTRAGRPLPGLPRFAVAGLHRNAALLCLVFLGVHVASAVIDPYVSLRWADVVLPFASGYHPAAIGLGALALDLMLAMTVTSMLRQMVGHRVWRAVHWSVYAAWPIAVTHSLALGPDVGHGGLLWITLGCLAATAAAVGWRASAPSDPALRQRVNG